MNVSVSVESLDWLVVYWQEHPADLVWEPLFVLPLWLRVWQRHFALGQETTILVAKQEGKVIGIAPLIIESTSARIIGSPDVCDYEDFIIAPGEETAFYQILFDYLKQRRVNVLEPGIVRADSQVMSSLVGFARHSGAVVVSEPDEVTLETDLPATWEEYLQSLDAKQRHEVKRKLRRLEEAGAVSYRIVTDAGEVPDFMDVFLKMFVESRRDKADFLTPEMEGFFRDLTLTMAQAGLLRSGILALDEKPVAAVLAFDYRDTVYLYNSGYDPALSQLSVGVLSKVMLIKDSIERHKKRFDFLKGDERYKYYLGGKEVQLHKCRIQQRLL